MGFPDQMPGISDPGDPSPSSWEVLGPGACLPTLLGSTGCQGAGFLPGSATTCPEIKGNTLGGARRARRIAGKSLAWTPPLPFVSPMTLARSLGASLSFLICTVGIAVVPTSQTGTVAFSLSLLLPRAPLSSSSSPR